MYQEHSENQPVNIEPRLTKNQYKQYTLYAIIIAFIAVIIAMVSLYLHAERRATAAANTPEQKSSPNYSAKTTASQENGIAENLQSTTYRVGIYKKKIAVFKDNETKPYWLTTLSVETLPEEDLRLLNKGLVFSTYNDVRAFLEDFE